MSTDTVEATTTEATEAEVTVEVESNIVFVPTRSRINPTKPEGPHFTEGVSRLFVTRNAEGTKDRALVTDDEGFDLEVGDTITVKRFGDVTVLAVRHADGEVEGDLPDANLALRLLG